MSSNLNSPPEASAIRILYECPYQRVVGKYSSGYRHDIPFPVYEPPASHQRDTLRAFQSTSLSPGPSAVTTTSFQEFKADRHKAPRYGPEDVSGISFVESLYKKSGISLNSLLQKYPTALTESMEVGWGAKDSKQSTLVAPGMVSRLGASVHLPPPKHQPGSNLASRGMALLAQRGPRLVNR